MRLISICNLCARSESLAFSALTHSSISLAISRSLGELFIESGEFMFVEE